MIRSFALSLLLVVATSPAMAAMITATASLDGSQEVPPNASSASGTATFTFDDVTGAYDFVLDVVNLDVFAINASIAGGIHIHEAPAGANGPIVIPVAADRTSLIVPAFGVFTFGAEGLVGDVDQIRNALLAGDLYINVHTEAFPGGEIRGQLAAVPVPGAFLLFGSALAGLIGLSRRRKPS